MTMTALADPEPTFLHQPPGKGSTLAAVDALELLDAYGIELIDWQRRQLTRMLTTKSDQDQSWTARDVTLVVPRQCGKSELAIARIIVGVVLFDEKSQIVTSHEYKTTADLLERLTDAINNSPQLFRQIRRIRTSHGSEIVEWRNGARTRFIARTARSGRGFPADLLILDEAFHLSPENLAALDPSLATSKNSQKFMLSSTGTFTAEVLLAERKRAYARTSTTQLYAEWSATSKDDPADHDVWFRVIPGLGTLIPLDNVTREHESMSRQDFARERLGVWAEHVDPTRLDWGVVEKLFLNAPPLPPDDATITFGVDVAQDRSDAAIVAVWHDKTFGYAIAHVVSYGAGSSWIEDRTVELIDKQSPSAIAYDSRGGLNDITDRLSRRRAMLHPITTADYMTACAAFESAVKEGRIRFGPDAALETHLRTAGSKQFASGWAWDRKAVVPPTTVIAATVALWAAEHPVNDPPMVFYAGAR